MKAITIRQPWAASIFTLSPIHPERGLKNIENRTWRTAHRGPLAIHASQKLAEGFTEGDIPKYRNVTPHGARDHRAWTRGAVIGVVDLVGICNPNEHEPCRFAEWAMWEGYHHWLLDRPRLLDTPIPLSGKPGLFDVDLDLPKAS